MISGNERLNENQGRKKPKRPYFDMALIEDDVK